MKTQPRRASPWAALLCGVGLLISSSGCILSARHGMEHVVGQHLAVDATSYNMAIEQTQNEMLLLNVIRAMNRYPLYITDASKVTGTVKSDLSLGLQLPFGHTANVNKFLGAPTLDVSTSPSVDVNLLNQKDFTTGFLKPISPDLFAYYWKEGWPAELMLYVFVLKAEPYRASIPPKEAERLYQNHPQVYDTNLTDLDSFAGWVKRVEGTHRPHLIPLPSLDIVGPSFPAPTDNAIDSLTAIGKEPSLTLKATGNGQWQISRMATSYVLCSRDLETCKSDVAPLEDPQTPRLIVDLGQNELYELSLRSPEGILYYLGELARIEQKAPHRALLFNPCDPGQVCTESKPEPLFVLRQTGEGEKCESAVSVTGPDQKRYIIPLGEEPYEPITKGFTHLQLADATKLCTTGRSMHALSLLSQLIGLQKSAADLAPTSTVKVVGQ